MTDNELYAPIYVFHYQTGRKNVKLAEYATEQAAAAAIFDLPKGCGHTAIRNFEDVKKLKPAVLVDFYNAIREPGEPGIIRFANLREGRERIYTMLASAIKTPAPQQGEGTEPEPVEDVEAAPESDAGQEQQEPAPESSDAAPTMETEEMATVKKAKKKGAAASKKKAAAPAKKNVARGVKAAAKTPKARKNGGNGDARPGIGAEVLRMVTRASGASKDEILKRLQELFPQREPVEKTVYGVTSALTAKYGKKFRKEKDRNRGGMVYKLDI
jgi:hypothetical protein